MATSSELCLEAYLLGEQINGHPERVDDALPRLGQILDATSDADAVVVTIDALAHAYDERAAEILLGVPVDHDEVDVRLALAQGLPNGVPARGPVRDAVLMALSVLSADVDDDVRDWACFGLGVLDADTATVRDALAARLDDPHDDTRCEALLALAQTGDVRALEALVVRLFDDHSTIWTLELQAAAALGRAELLPLLTALAREWEGDDDAFTAELAVAIERCGGTES